MVHLNSVISAGASVTMKHVTIYFIVHYSFPACVKIMVSYCLSMLFCFQRLFLASKRNRRASLSIKTSSREIIADLDTTKKHSNRNARSMLRSGTISRAEILSRVWVRSFWILINDDFQILSLKILLIQSFRILFWCMLPLSFSVGDLLKWLGM